MGQNGCAKMTENKVPTPLAEEDYDAIEAAVMETQRGRWFLSEFARRNRNSDTVILLDAIKKLERAVEQPAAGLEHEQVRFDLMEMASEIAQTRLDIAAIAPKDGGESQLTSVADELGSVVTATEEATYKILAGAEGVQEMVWRMRDSEAGDGDCDRLEQFATDIFSACDFQDLTGQRIAKVVHVLGYIEERLNSMIEIWGDDSLIDQSERSDDLEITDSYLQAHVAINQDTVDDLMFEAAEHASDASKAALPAPVPIEPVEAEGDEEAHEPEESDDSNLWVVDDEPEEPENGNPELNASAPQLLSASAAESIDDRSVSASDIEGLSQDEKTALFT